MRQTINHTIRPLLQLIAPYKYRAICTFLMVIGNSASILYLVKKFESIFAHQGIPWFGIILLTIIAASTGARIYMTTSLGEIVLHHIRCTIFTKALQTDHTMNPAEMSMRSIYDASQIQTGIINILPAIIRQSAIASGAMILLAIQTPIIMITGIIGTGLYTIASRKLRSVSRKWAKIGQEHMENTISFAQERIDLINTVKLFGQSIPDTNTYNKLSENTMHAWNISNKWRAVTSTTSIILGGIMTILFVLWAKNAVIHHTITPSTLASSLVLVLIAGNAASSLVDACNAMGRIQPSLERIDTLINTPAPIIPPANPATLTSQAPTIEFNNIHVRIDEQEILRGVNIRIPQGTSLAITGPSGGGKSTLLRVLLGQLPPSNGTIYWNQTDLHTISVPDRLCHIAVVPQIPDLFNTDIQHNIQYGNNANKEILQRAIMESQSNFINNLPEKMAYNVGIRGTLLSGGQRQRIAIARALARTSPLLVLDEATSALDAATEHALNEAMQQQEYPHTTIAVAHRLSTLLQADNIAWMERGIITHQGTHDWMLQHCPAYANMVEHYTTNT